MSIELIDMDPAIVFGGGSAGETCNELSERWTAHIL